jgi:V/A-type H+-transporting ATPase subunit D
MAKLRIPPTKSNYLRIQKQQEFARDGYDLLEQKRQILVLELVNRVEAAKRAQQDVDERMAQAYAALRKAASRVGSFQMRNEAAAALTGADVDISSHQLMGIALPTVRFRAPELVPQFALAAGTPGSDQVLLAFNRALAAVARLAEIENAVFRLAREVKKTQRRVNALEKIFIPTYRETLRYIESTLEEREREGFVIMKMVKERREALKELRQSAQA